MDPKEPLFVTSPITPPENSKIKRVAKLRLLEDGAIEGSVRVEYPGHHDVEMKESYDEKTPEQRRERLTEIIKKRLNTAELILGAGRHDRDGWSDRKRSR
ncbi:MAG TPA: hypothetical protein VJ302_00070 [Blastocatellia bacterium]|nr:hypothetical protein [Blastocatellia bacterium]